ncbi:MAG: hypothetical protein ABFS46_06055 [Myxococcota bacterium]
MSAVTPDLNREQLAGLVCATLDRHGVQVVLSGGGAASIYAPSPYESMDLDFIPIGLSRRVDAAMLELGFRKEHQRHWTHPGTAFWIEFPPGPVQVGDEVVHDFAERQTAHGILRILTPTDSVMDRLAWYYHASDTQTLEQAVGVAAANEVDLERIEAWSKRERADEKFERFRTRLRGESGSK